MDSVGNFLNEDWNSLSKMFSSTDEEIDFALQFLKGFGTDPSNFWPFGEANANANLAIFDENFNPNFYFSQESTNYSSSNNYSSCFPTPSHENHHFCDSNLIPMMNDIPESMNFCIMDGEINALAQVFPNDQVMQDVHSLNEQMGNDTLENADNTDLGLKRKFEDSQQPETVKDLSTKSESVEHPKKKSRAIRDTPKNKRNTQPKKNQKLIQNVNNDEESNYASPNGQSSSSCSSEDDSNASQELNGGSAALNSSGKARASRGAATDPQSLYARKRRERINERLRILQNLVPSGTKVDISTMLEEAVHYVKFLQLQIKLLSSDDMWMYAPIAYNGMDMGLYQKISPTL